MRQRARAKTLTLLFDGRIRGRRCDRSWRGGLLLRCRGGAFGVGLTGGERQKGGDKAYDNNFLHGRMFGWVVGLITGT